MTQTLSSQREQLQAAHERLRRAAERHGAGEALRDLEAAERRLDQTVFRLVVLGEYKRGKSTLINALLGRQVLPMAVVPLTSVVTEVRYREEPGVTIEFLDGRSQAIGPEELSSFVTEPGNPRNAKGVRRAIVHEPSSLLREGVTMVDTPGVGSVFRHNSEVTYEFLEESDAVVFVLAADQPLGSEERDLLEALEGITDRILFAVNRVDVLSAEEAATSLRFIRETLETLTERPAEMVFPLSARGALEARLRHEPVAEPFELFEGALHRVLIQRKADILIERAWTITRRSTEVLALRLRTERQATQLAGEQLTHAIEEFRSATSSIKERLEQSELLLRHQVERIHSVELEREADAVSARITAELWPRIEAAIHSVPRQPLPRVVTGLSAEIGKWVVADLRHHYRGTEELVQRRLSRALEEHMTRVQAAVGEVVELANALLGMRAEVPRALAPVDERPRFYFKEWDYAGGQLRGPRWVLHLPRRWAEPRALEQLRELLDRRIHQNLGAIRYDWMTRLDDAMRRFQASSREQLAAVITVITEALDRAEGLGVEERSAGRAIELDRELQEIGALQTSLAGAVVAEAPMRDGPDPGHDRGH